jgi:hypothetical protein
VVSAVSLGISAYTVIRERITAGKLKSSLGKIEEMSEDKITDLLIQKAVDKAADKMVGEYMQETENKVLRIAHSDLEAAARNAVDKYSADIRKKAADEVSRQVANLDIEKLKNRVCDQAEREVLKKLDGCMDQYAKKFADSLDNQRKIYDRIAQATLEKERRDDGLHVVLL